MVEYIDVKFILSWGSIGPCCICKTRLTENMGFILYNSTKTYRCSECLNEYGGSLRTVASFEENDAKFMCPEKNCNEALSFREFLNGSCCSVAMSYCKTSVKDKNYRAEFQDLTKMMRELEILDKEEAEAKIEMENKEKELDAATAQYFEKIQSRERLQTDLAMAFSETSDMLLEGKETSENSRFNCNICFEKYNADDRLQCVLQCGHPACEKCLTALPDKLCPICRNPFTGDNIIKIFYN